jgi:hypothetical protein
LTKINYLFCPLSDSRKKLIIHVTSAGEGERGEVIIEINLLFLRRIFRTLN